VELEARPATVYSNEFTSYEYPYVRFTSKVGSGTYVRSLVEDLGKILGTGAYMSDLRRTTVGEFDIAGAVTPDKLDSDALAVRLQSLEG
jgi:tRNA pseudouridine55 synthase